jgi:molybdopterin-binding protein
VALAAKLSDLIAFLHEGMLVQIGPVEEVLTKPASARIARFVGFENIFEGNIVSVKMGIVKVDVEGIEIEAVSDKRGRCTVAIRPEDVVVSKAPFESSMRNTFEGRIIRIVDIGPLIKVIVNVHGLPIAALLTRRSFQDLGLRERDNAYISFKASCVYVI